MAAHVVVPGVYLILTVIVTGTTPAIVVRDILFENLKACEVAREEYLSTNMHAPPQWRREEGTRAPDYVSAQCSEKRK